MYFCAILFTNLMKYFVIVLALFCALPLSAQQQAPKDPQKQLRENIDLSLEKYERTLELEGWQMFYLDSIMTHDYSAMMAEMEDISKAKVENTDIYMQIQDKWNEKIYSAFHKVLNDEQWSKYLKQGAAREKKARDKRESKRNK